MAAKDLNERSVKHLVDPTSGTQLARGEMPMRDPLLPPHLAAQRGVAVESASHPLYSRARMLSSLGGGESPKSPSEVASARWRAMRQDSAAREVFRGAHTASSKGSGDSRTSYLTLLPQLSITKGLEGSTGRASPTEVAQRVLSCWVEALRSQGNVASGEDDAESVLREEAAYLSALEMLLTGAPFATPTSVPPLSPSEVRAAVGLGLVDLELVSSAVVGDDAGCSVRDAVLPEDTLDALQMAEHVCKWIREVHTSQCSTLPNDQIAALYLRAELAKRGEANRSRGVTSHTAAAAEAQEFTAEEVALLEEYERSKLGGVRGSAASAAVLSDTNPVLRRAASLDEGLEESMRVMDRVRQSALLDSSFQEALAYSNALYERDFERASDLYSMRSYTDEELRELEIGRQVSGKSLSRESKEELDRRLRGIRKRHSDREQSGEAVGEQGEREQSNSSSRPAEPWRDARGKHRISVAKAMRVMNPDSALRPDGGAADMPYFVGPSGGRSFPPPQAAFNLPVPAPTKYGRRSPRYKGDKSGERIYKQ